MDSNEINRLLLNLVRKGTILAVDHDAEMCRVKSGELETNWIRWLSFAAGETIDWNPPTVGEQVLLLSPGGDPADAVALRGIYSDEAPAPSHSPTTHTRKFPDGAVIEYDHASHALTATLPAGGTVVLTSPAAVTVNTTSAVVNASSDATVNTGSAAIHADSVTLDSPQTTCTGNLTVQGHLSFLAGMSGKGGAGGGAAATIQGTLATTEDVKAGAISLNSHTHTEQGDGASTSGPQ